MFAAAMKSIHTTTWNNAKSLATADKSGEYHGRLALFFHSIRGINRDKLDNNMEKECPLCLDKMTYFTARYPK